MCLSALGQVERRCDRAIWIDEGRIRDDETSQKSLQGIFGKDGRIQVGTCEETLENIGWSLKEQKKRELEEEKRRERDGTATKRTEDITGKKTQRKKKNRKNY